MIDFGGSNINACKHAILGMFTHAREVNSEDFG